MESKFPKPPQGMRELLEEPGEWRCVNCGTLTEAFVKNPVIAQGTIVVREFPMCRRCWEER